MTDRELLEAAAKAVGRKIEWMTLIIEGREPEEFSARWNPLTCNDNAFQIATTLHMMINIEHGQTEVCAHPAVSAADSIVELHNGDPLAATRRAIVRCAAQGVTK